MREHLHILAQLKEAYLKTDADSFAQFVALQSKVYQTVSIWEYNAINEAFDKWLDDLDNRPVLRLVK
jgi:hypothetical protein